MDSGGSYESSSNSFGRSSPMEKRPAMGGSSSSRMADAIDDDIPF
jgi:hypothetical protein